MKKVLFLCFSLALLTISCEKDAPMRKRMDASTNVENSYTGTTQPYEAPPPTNLTKTQEKSIYTNTMSKTYTKSFGNVTSALYSFRNSPSSMADNDPDGSSNNSGSTGYKYSVTFWFDQNWPTPNYKITVYFNLGPDGKITQASYTISNWGSYISGQLVSDANSYVYWSGNSISFNLTAYQSQPFSLFGTTNAQTNAIGFTGWVQTTSYGGASAGTCTLAPRKSGVE